MTQTGESAPGDGPGARCLNCGAELTGRFCASCGQEDRPPDLPVRRMLRDFWGDVFDLDSRAYRTLVLLITRPEALTTEYFRGRRARYLSPLRLYLVTGIVFALVAAELGEDVIQISVGEVAPAAEAAAPTAEEAAPAPTSPATTPDVTPEGTPEVTPDVTVDETPGEAVDEADDDDGSWIARRAARGRRMANEEPARFRARFFDVFPWAVVVFMAPAFAGLLRLSERRPFVHHLVFTLHFFSFGFVALTLSVLATVLPIGRAGSGLAIAFFLIPGAYLPLALHRFYGRAWTGVAARSVGLMLGSVILLALAVMVTLAMAVLLV